MKYRLLDLFSGAGGAAMGYHRAGFEVIGVDINPQPNFPFEFHKADAVNFEEDILLWKKGRKFDVIHASPPCQAYCALKTMKNSKEHPRLISIMRDKLKKTGMIWIIENVAGSTLINPIMLCGSHFNLTTNEYQLRRHRYFESNILLLNGNKCDHWKKTIGVYGSKARDLAKEKRHYKKDKKTRGKPIGIVLPKEMGFEAMGIDWMTQKELSQAIPPAYTEFIGKQIIRHLDNRGN